MPQPLPGHREAQPGGHDGRHAAGPARQQQERDQLPARYGQGGHSPVRPGQVRAGDGAHRAEAGNRRLVRLAFGHADGDPRGRRLAQVILGLGQDLLGLPGRDAQPPPQLLQVVPDQVARAAVVFQADHPGTA